MPKPRQPTRPFAARLSEEAHARIHTRAALAGLSARAWLEAAILEEKATIISRAKPHRDLAGLLYQVNKAGNNVNQLALHFNTLVHKNPLTNLDAITALIELKRIRELLGEAINRAS